MSYGFLMPLFMPIFSPKKDTNRSHSDYYVKVESRSGEFQ